MLEDILYIRNTFYESLYVQQIHVFIYLQNPKMFVPGGILFPRFTWIFFFVNLLLFSNSNPVNSFMPFRRSFLTLIVVLKCLFVVFSCLCVIIFSPFMFYFFLFLECVIDCLKWFRDSSFVFLFKLISWSLLWNVLSFF